MIASVTNGLLTGRGQGIIDTLADLIRMLFDIARLF